MNEKLLKKIADADGLYIYDYSLPEDVEDVLEFYGGEKRLKQQFPLIYSAFCKTVDSHRQRSGAAGGEQKLSLTIDAFDVVENQNQSAIQAASTIRLADPNYTAEDQAEGKTPASWLGANLVVSIYNKNEPAKVYYSDCFYFKEPENCSFDYGADYIDPENVKSCATAVSMHALDPSGQLVSCAKSREMEPTGLRLINKFTISDPRSQKHSKVLMLYGRHRSDNPSAYIDADYYNDDKEGEYYKNSPNGGKIKTLMPMSGTIEFAQDCKFPDEGVLRKPDLSSRDYKHLIRSIIEIGSTKVADMYRSLDDDAAYKILHKCFTTDTSGAYPTVKFDIKNNGSVDWLDDVEGISAFSDRMVTYYLSGAFTLNFITPNGDPTSAQFSIVSIDPDKKSSKYQYYISNSTMVYVPPIEIHWGCFAYDTLIRMEDGSDKQIRDVNLGDRLLANDGSFRTCVDMLTGVEDTIFVVQTKHHRVRLTGGHPILCADDSVVRAVNIRQGMKVKTLNGFEEVVRVDTEEYGEKVYNPVLEDSESGEIYILADGIFCGDYSAQNHKVAAGKAMLGAEEKALLDEFQNLARQLGAKFDETET